MAYIGRDLRTGAFRQLDDISSGFDGSDTTHTMQVNSTNVSVGDVNQILLSLGGVIQKPGTDFTVSGSTLTFTTAPAANTNFFAILLGSDNGGTVTPTDNSVTPPKTTFFNTDPGNAADLGTLHIKTADSSAATSTSADELVLENSTHCGISILSGTAATGNVYFNDSGGVARGYVEYDHNTDKLSVGTASANAITISSDGEINSPKQPAFRVKPSSDQNDIAANGSLVAIAFGTEVFDVGGNFASNAFTAPVTGKYQLSLVMYSEDRDDAASYAYITLATSNQSYYHIIDPAVFDEDSTYFTFTMSVLADMDAGDTAGVTYTQVGGSAQTDITTNSHFTGFLAC